MLRRPWKTIPGCGTASVTGRVYVDGTPSSLWLVLGTKFNVGLHKDGVAVLAWAFDSESLASHGYHGNGMSRQGRHFAFCNDV